MSKKFLIVFIAILCLIIVAVVYLMIPQLAVEKDYKQISKETPYEPPIPKAIPKLEPQPISKPYDEYQVRLSGDKMLKLPGKEGHITVWIGKKEFLPSAKTYELYDEAKIAALSQWAKIEPYSTGFTFIPNKSVCIKIHETGSEAIFKIKPIDEGSYTVGAKVELYEEKECQGTPIPKTTANLIIVVEEDPIGYIKLYLEEIWEISWKAFSDFWAAFLAIGFGFILFLFRKKLKEKFGYEHE